MKGYEQVEEGREYNEGRRRFLRTCSALLVGAAIETIAPLKLLSAIPEKQRERFPNGIQYMSPESAVQYKDLERIYPELCQVDAPVVIGSENDFLKNMREETRINFQGRFMGVKAFAFTGAQFTEDLREAQGLREDEYYIMYRDLPEDRKVDIVKHESFHIAHFIKQRKKNPKDITGLKRFPELSEEVNSYFEELVTCADTIDWLQMQTGGNQSVLTREEFKYLPHNIAMQKKYLLESYEAYYWSRYQGAIQAQYGDSQEQVIDPVDNEAEKIFIKYNIFETARERNRNEGLSK